MNFDYNEEQQLLADSVRRFLQKDYDFEARNVIPKWRANKELMRKHFLLELNGKTGAGVYIWPSVEAAQKAHNEEWRQSVIKRTGGAPTIRYFDLFLLIDNEKGAVTEFPEAAEIQSAAA